MPEKHIKLSIGDVIKYGIILVSAGIQVGLFYATRSDVQEHKVKISFLENVAAKHGARLDVLEVVTKEIK